MKVFSFSRLNLYQTCPHRFYKRYVEGYKEPVTYPLALGKGVHKAVEEKMRGIEHQLAVETGMKEINYHPEVTREELSWLAGNAPTHEVSGEIERYFKLPLADESDSPYIQGFIDVIGNGYIVDWKTNRAMYDVLENHQIGLYSWAVQQLFGWTEVYGRLYFLRFRRESYACYGRSEMEMARKWAYDLAKEIQAKLEMVKALPELKDELFPATPQSFCSHCPFSYECHVKFSSIY